MAIDDDGRLYLAAPGDRMRRLGKPTRYTVAVNGKVWTERAYSMSAAASQAARAHEVDHGPCSGLVVTVRAPSQLQRTYRCEASPSGMVVVLT